MQKSLSRLVVSSTGVKPFSDISQGLESCDYPVDEDGSEKSFECLTGRALVDEFEILGDLEEASGRLLGSVIGDRIFEDLTWFSVDFTIGCFNSKAVGVSGDTLVCVGSNSEDDVVGCPPFIV